MEFLLGLSKKEQQRRIARHRRLRRCFWALGTLLLAIQILAISYASPQPQAAATQQPPEIPATATIAENDTAIRPSPTATLTPTRPLPTPTATALLTGHSDPIQAPPTAQPTLQPAPLILTSPSSPSTQVSEQTFQLAGTGQPGSSVSLSYHSSQLARTEVDPQGHWHVDVPTAPLDRGPNTLTLSGSTSTTAPISLTVEFDPWWLDAPQRLQASLGQGYACAPIVLGMAMDYHHQSDASHPAPASTELVEALTSRGFISGYGADATMLVDLAISYGYSHSFFYRTWSQAHLRHMLDAGQPVIANVRIGLGETGYGHSVLVIGMSPDGQRLMLNDPAQGMVETTWDTFDRSWASFGPPYRHGAVIQP